LEWQRHKDCHYSITLLKMNDDLFEIQECPGEVFDYDIFEESDNDEEWNKFVNSTTTI
jgi:L-rhamnose mutarotase